jgi:hypothetical protein
MKSFLKIGFLLLPLLLVELLPAAVVITRLSSPFDANAGETDNEAGYKRRPIDFNGDGLSELVVVATETFVDLLHLSTSRVFILTSPPPNIGGSVASIFEGTEIDGNSGNSLFRWYRGQPLLNAYPEISDRITTIAYQFTTGSNGHTRGKDGYLGFEFELEDGVHYAWIHFDASANARDETGFIFGVGGYIDSWAWETTPRLGIVAGAVPEPSAAIFFYIPLAGFLLRRRR